MHTAVSVIIRLRVRVILCVLDSAASLPDRLRKHAPLGVNRWSLHLSARRLLCVGSTALPGTIVCPDDVTVVSVLNTAPWCFWQRPFNGTMIRQNDLKWMDVIRTQLMTDRSFDLSPQTCSHYDAHPLLELPPPRAAAVWLSSRGGGASADDAHPAQGDSRTCGQGASGRQLRARATRRTPGGVAQQHVGYGVWRRGGHQAGQRCVSRAGLPGRDHVGSQRQIWRRTRWRHFLFVMPRVYYMTVVDDR